MSARLLVVSAFFTSTLAAAGVLWTGTPYDASHVLADACMRLGHAILADAGTVAAAAASAAGLMTVLARSSATVPHTTRAREVHGR